MAARKSPKRRTSKPQEEDKGPLNPIFETISRYGTFAGVGLIAYLQTMFPSREEFIEVERKLQSIDKSLTEIVIIQKNFEQTRIKIDNLQERLREVELKQASQKAGQ